MSHPPLLRRSAFLAPVVAVSLLFAACDDEPTGTRQGYTLRIESGNDQFAGFGQELENPLRVIVENARTGDPVAGIAVEWSILEGEDAELIPTQSTSDANGVASTFLVLGSADAEYRVRATVANLVGPSATFVATAVSPAHIDSVAPGSVVAGGTVVVHGHGFDVSAQNNTVLIAGFRATVLEATATRLSVVVPECTPTRADAEVRVDRGIVESNAATLDVTGTGAAPVSMNVGEVLYLDDAAAASCLRIAPTSGGRYLLLLQNATTIGGQELPWRLSAALSAPFAAPDRFASSVSSAAPFDGAPRRATDPQERLDFELREIEAAAALRAPRRSAPPATSRAVDPPEIGDRRDFWVFRRAGEYERITAIVRHVSDHAVLYEDVDAPGNGFGTGDFEAFGALFDDPIYETLTAVYGQPSDVDDNDRIAILFTPVVNRLTPANSGSAFVAGFFFGIDLLDDQEHGNDAEVFYTLVPDPQGEFGNVRTFDQLLQSVPPVMAHEFQHMLHFNQRVLQRDASLEQTWLSEGLAHTAEELVADAFDAAGNTQRAFDFRVQNFLRADAWLSNTDVVSPLGPAVPLAVRGASWMLLEYLRGHFGDDAFLTELTQTTTTGVANVTAATGLDWATVLHRWGLAVWADDAGIPGINPIYSYPDVNLRQVYQTSGFPLIPEQLAWTDFSRTGELPSAGSHYWILDGGVALAQLNVSVAGRHTPFGSADRPQLSVLRIQ